MFRRLITRFFGAVKADAEPPPVEVPTRQIPPAITPPTQGIEPICPYCKSLLAKAPQRKKKCQFCGEFIFVRTLPSTRARVLVTADQAEQIDAQWKAYTGELDIKRLLQGAGISHNDFITQRAKHSAAWSDRDILRRLFNLRVVQLSATHGTFHDFKMVYLQMAFLNNFEGLDAHAILQEVTRMDLLSRKEGGVIDQVKIITAKDKACSACRELDEKVFSIEEALQTMPIPHRGCTSELYSAGVGFCRCGYVAYLGDRTR